MCWSKPKGSSLPSTAHTESYISSFPSSEHVIPLQKMSLVLIPQLLSISWLLSVIIISFIFLGMIPLKLKTHTKQRPWKPTAWSHQIPLHGPSDARWHEVHRWPPRGTWKNEFHGTVFFSGKSLKKTIPKCSMYGIFTHIWHKIMVNVGGYSLHGGAFGYG